MIEQIRIQNYKTCKNVRIKIKEPFMALIGKNAVGKSNTLKGIHLASHQIWPEAAQPPLEKPNKNFSAEFVFQYKKEQLYYWLKVYQRKDIYVRDSLYIKANGKLTEVFNKNRKVTLKVRGHLSPIFLPEDVYGLDLLCSILLSEKEKPDFTAQVSKYRSQIFYVLSQLLGVKYYGVQEQPNLVPITEEEFSGWKKSPDSQTTKSPFSCQYYDFYKNRPNDFAQYMSLLQSLGLIEHILSFEPTKDSSNKGLGQFYVFLFKENGKYLSFESLSDGTKRVIRLLFHLLYGKPSLMLIEEPESSIHYGLLVKLLSIFQQYTEDKKILISTHSEQVLNQLKPEQLIYLYKEKGTTKAKYVAGRNLSSVRDYLAEVGPLGEYVTSGELEGDLEG